MTISRRRMMTALAVTTAMGVATTATAQTTAKPAVNSTTTSKTTQNGKTVVVAKPASTLPANGPIVAQAGMIRAHDGDLTGMAGMIRAHVGDVNPFWGDTTAYWGAADPLGTDLGNFWGNLTPYAGMIRAHEGSVTPLAGMIRAHDGSLTAMAGMIRAHWGEIGATAGMIRAHQDATRPDHTAALANMRAFVSQSETFWAAPVLRDTGKSFRVGFADPLLAKFGINLDNAASLMQLTPDKRELFFLEWQDGLMQFSGADQVDHWMKTANWTPALTQQQSGTEARKQVIGIVDLFNPNNVDLVNKVHYSGGYNTPTLHGAAVGSLLLAPHDGKGVMGIAPYAKVAAYNPFDGSYTANWADVTTGISKVAAANAGVINLSLGVPGFTLHPEWKNVFVNSDVNKHKMNTLYIIAAGNSTTTAQPNVEMNGALDTTYLVVGALGVDGKIASFSNQPGFTCLTDGGQCKNTQRAGVGTTGDRFIKTDYLKESGYLMNRFLVAPGEMILVSDGQGGVTRMSGTSFAAPIVSGAVALILHRWPWLRNYPRDVAKILLDTATDLGERGADPVFGRGLINIEASQKALDFDKLRFELWNGKNKTDFTATSLRRSGFQSAWANNDMYFAAFEKLEAGERDFLIPLSSRLFGTLKNNQYFQEFMYNHFTNWLKTGVGFAGVPGQRMGFSDVNETALTGDPDAWSFGMAGRMVREQFPDGQMGQMSLRSTVTMRSPSKAFSLSFGSGDGAVNLAGQQGLLNSADLDPFSGGVNPLLGFASGGAHLGSSLALSSKVSVSVGATEQRRTTRQELVDVNSVEDRIAIGGRGGYSARAQNVRVDYRPTGWLGVSASMTRLDEDRALLGVRSLADSDFGQGTVTNGVTVQGDVSLTKDLVVFGSATAARSTSPDRDAALRIGNGGVVGSAFQLGLAKTRVLGKHDRVRLAISQPLYMERGTMDFSSIMVVDRETGAKGLVTQTVDLAGSQPRRLLGEASYGTLLMDGRAELSLFGRGEMRRAQSDTPRVMAGGRASLTF